MQYEDYDSDEWSLSTEEFNGTDLHDAIYAEDADRVQMLLANPSTDVNLANDYDRTPLMVAACRGTFKMAKMLLACPNINVNAQRRLSGRYGVMALSNACEYGHTKVVRLLLACANIDVNHQDEGGFTALTWTAQGNKVELLQLLLDFPETKLNLLTKSGKTALDFVERPEMKAIFIDHITAPPISKGLIPGISQSILTAARRGEALMIRELLKTATAADVNYRDENGNTALLNAVYHEHTDVIKMLLAHPGIDVNITHKNGFSALLVAACGQPAVVKMLLSAPDINVNSQEAYGQTALIRAIVNGRTNIVKLLLACPRVDAHLRQKNGCSPLMLACTGHNDIVKLLLAVPGVDVNCQDDYGRTALMIAVYHQRSVILRLLLAVPGLQGDLENGKGETALILAANGGYQLADELLSSKKVDVNLVTKTNKTALEQAKNGRLKALLRIHGAKKREGKGTQKKTSKTTIASVANPSKTVTAACTTAHSTASVLENCPSTTPNASTISVGSSSRCIATAAAAVVAVAASHTANGTASGSCTAYPPSVMSSAAALGLAGSVTDAVVAVRPTSWLAERLLLGGMAEPSVRDCEQKLVHNEGFSNVRDFAECPAAEFTRDYLVSIGISGLGTQRHVLRLYNELHSVYKQQAPLSVAVEVPPSVTMGSGTPANRDSSDSSQSDSDSNSTQSSDDSSISTRVLSSDGSGRGNESNSHKRSRAEAFECDSTPSEHAFVPSYPNKK